MAFKTAGWTLTTSSYHKLFNTTEGNLEEHALGATIVRPFADKNEFDYKKLDPKNYFDEVFPKLMTGRGAKCSGEEADEILGNWLKPWYWEKKVEWLIVAVQDPADGTPEVYYTQTLNKPTYITEDLHPDDIKNTRESFDDELTKKTKDGEFAFSAHPDDAVEASKRSIVHAIAPLAHLVVPLSQQVFNFGHVIPFNVDPSKKYFVFPQFEFYFKNESSSKKYTAKVKKVNEIYQIKSNDDLAIAEYEVVDEQGNALQDKSFVLVVEGASGTGEIAKLDEDGELNSKLQDAVALAVPILDPVKMASEILHQTKSRRINEKLIEQWKRFLLRYMGAGWTWELDADDEDLDHVFDIYSSHHKLRNIFNIPESLSWIGELNKKFPREQGKFDDLMVAITGQNIYDHFPPDDLDFKNSIKSLFEEHKDKDKEKYKNLEALDSILTLLTNTEKSQQCTALWYQFLLNWKAAPNKNYADLYSDIRDGMNRNQYELALADSYINLIYGKANGDSKFKLALEHFVKNKGNTDLLKQSCSECLDDLFITVDSCKDDDKECKEDALKTQEVKTKTIKLYCEQLTKSWSKRNDKILFPKDRGLSIKLEGELSKKDELIRGYSVALRADFRINELGEKQPKEKGKWITNSQIVYYDGSSDANLIRTMGGNGVWAAATVGSSESGGRRVTNIHYERQPVIGVPGNSKIEDGSLIYLPTVDKDVDFDETESLDYVWSLTEKKGTDVEEFQLPILGYGLNYSAVQTEIDNLGVVGEKSFRNRVYVGELIPPEEFTKGTKWNPLGRYLSFEPPGSPEVQLEQNYDSIDPFELTTETMAFAAWQKRSENSENNEVENIKVALLAPKNGDGNSVPNKFFSADCPISYSLQILPPIAHIEFLNRFLATDLFLHEKIESDDYKNDKSKLEKFLSDEHFNSKDELLEQLKKLRKAYKALEQTDQKSSSLMYRYHPAIERIGVKITWFHGEKIVLVDGEEYKYISFSNMRTDTDGNIFVWDKIKKEFPHQCALKVETGNTNKIEHQGGAWVVGLKPSHYCKIEVLSLIEKKFFENNEHQRYSEVMIKGDNNICYEWPNNEQGESTFCAFAPSEHWFECAPEWDSGDNVKPWENVGELSNDQFTIEGADIHLPETSVLRHHNKNGKIKANWLKGFYVERHDWRWVGLPLTFADNETNSLQKHLLSFSGIDSRRDYFEQKLNTNFDEDNDWIVENQHTLYSHPVMNGPRPVRLSAYPIKPIVRFRKWLKSGEKDGPLDIEINSFGTASILKGIAPIKRLPIPVMKWNFPLTESYEEQANSKEALPTRGRNGNLIVFDEPFLKTGEGIASGGIGEVIEVDVVDARLFNFCQKSESEQDNSTEFYFRKEMGPNPIFHSSPEIPSDSCAKGKGKNFVQFDVESSLPFGLTRDKGSNPKITQTAISVFPKLIENGSEINSKLGGRWLLAKIRARRMILPEVLAGSALQEQIPNGPTIPEQQLWKLILRNEGEDIVPIDLSLDYDKKNVPKSLWVDKLLLKIPERVKDAGRLVITWHKGRWGTAEAPRWRPQLDCYKKDKDKLKWNLVERVSPFEQKDWKKAELKSFEVRVEPAVKVTISAIPISDYTEPQWISFIGSFGRQELGRSDQYLLRPVQTNILKLERTDDSFDLPQIQSLSQSLRFDRNCIDVPLKSLDRSEEGAETLFNLLLVYEPLPSAIYGHASSTSGRHVATYYPIKKSQEDKASEVKFLRVETKSEELEFDGTQIAYLLTFQRISSLSKNEYAHLIKINAHSEDLWKQLQHLIFPEFDKELGLNQKEALIRPVPQYLGPIIIKQ